jgi:hypothetical protein
MQRDVSLLVLAGTSTAPHMTDGPALEYESCRRIPRISQALRYDRGYPRADFWRAFLAWEHKARRATQEVHDF